MYTAFDLGDELRLAAPGQLADEQGSWLDEHVPVSAPSAMAGARSLWATLADDALRRPHPSCRPPHLPLAAARTTPGSLVFVAAPCP